VLVLKICVSRYNKSGEGPVSAFCPTWLNGELKEHSNGTQPQTHTHTHTHVCTLDMHMCVFKCSFLFFLGRGGVLGFAVLVKIEFGSNFF